MKFISRCATFVFSSCAAISAQTLTYDFESVNPFNGGLGVGIGVSGSSSLLVGGQNDPAATANFSSQLGYNANELGKQLYAMSMDIGIEATGSGSAIGFQVTQSGTLNNGIGPNFQFVQGHDGGNFVFSTGQQGMILSQDIHGNSWSFDSSAPQVGEIFSFQFLTEFYYPGSGDSSLRTFDYSFSAYRSDPNGLSAVDELHFTGSKTHSAAGFTNDLGKLTFRGSGVGGFQGSMDNLVVSTGAIATIPEPGFGLLLVSGVGLILARRRPRK